jgi:hypothetical protein
MDRVGAASRAGRENGVRLQITLVRRTAADRDRFIRQSHMQRRFIGIRMNRDGRKAERAPTG